MVRHLVLHVYMTLPVTCLISDVWIRCLHRRSQDFVWGCTFSYRKSWRPFFRRRPQRTSKYTSKSNPPSKNCPKNWLLLWLGGALHVLGGALTHFPCKLRLKNFFSPSWVGAGAPTAPPGYAYGCLWSKMHVVTSHTHTCMFVQVHCHML